MAVEALRLIREGEEESRKLIEEAKERAAKIIKDAEEEANRIKEKAREDAKSLVVQISDKYAKKGKEEESAIMKNTEAEVEKLKSIAESNIDPAVNLVLEKNFRFEVIRLGATEIVEKIKDEAVSEREKIISVAKKKADELIKEAKAQVELQKKRVIEAEERKGVEELERIIRAARLNARKLRWAAEKEMITKALKEAMKRIKEVKTSGFQGNSYSDILAGLIRDATRSLTAGTRSSSELEVMLSEEDAPFVTSDMLKNIADKISAEGMNIRLSLSDERIKSVGGVIVRSKDGKVEVNNAFEQRLARFSTSLREDIVKTLFKEVK